MWAPLYPPISAVLQEPPSSESARSTNNKVPKVPSQMIAVYPAGSTLSFQSYPHIIANLPVGVISQQGSEIPTQTSTPLKAETQLQHMPRRYQVREKIFSLGDNFKIKDDCGNHMFTVRSKFLSVGDHLILENASGLRLIKIREEILHLHPTFQIMSISNGRSDSVLASIKKKFTLFRNKFSIKSVYGEYDLEALDVFSHSFSLTKAGKTSAIVSKKHFSMANTYLVEIADDKDDHVFVLALVIVINQVLFDS
ncbi:unnamed protein product [Rotaria sp. Silwood1]|nr:unnamed protein product [Rotaria sp. Silwood1]